ncbi:glycosyltransferase family 4 protein [Runella sp.]|uniref:glycosyltransferase family 4 protein n=1 Tax=Runella sp. TaxID=1960881 RepID=UPI003D10B27D
MKVLYDHQTFTGTQYGGISRYFYELMNAFAGRRDIEFELALKFSNSEYLRDVNYSHPVRYQQFANNPRANQVFSRLNRLYSSTKLGKGNFDIFHPTYYHSYFLDKVGKKPMVLTFHDVLSEKYGKMFPVLGEGLSELKQKLLKRADIVISVSEATKRGILEYFDIDEAKIKVIPLGNYLDKPTLIGQTTLNLPERYVLFVGKRDYYKNFVTFLEAMTAILLKDSDLRLVCGGGGTFSNEEKRLISEAGIQDQVLYHPIFDDTTLVELYERAQVFVFPSLMEGFGLPVLEAMSCGCPVAVTTGTSFDEIADEAGVYFEAESKDSIKDAVEKVIYNQTLQDQMRRLGYERVPLFKAETTAQKTLEVYKELANA